MLSQTLLIFALIAIPAGYLLGSLSNSIIISKIYFRKDVRDYGSHNAGGTNTGRVFGKKMGALIILLDMLKAIAVYYVLHFVMGWFGIQDNTWAQVIAALTLVALELGHCFPVFFKFKGGKGVAMFAGIIIASNWLLLIIGAALFFIILYVRKYVSLSSILDSSILAALSYFYLIPEINNFGFNLSYTNPLIYAVMLTLLAILIVLQHRGNIKRMIEGTENKFQ